MTDPYAVLGVAPTASQADLKAAHRALVRRHHPDLRPEAERAAATRAVQEINVAYGMLRDPAHRARTDALLRTHAGGRAWDDLVTEAGRWAGRWWKRNRVTLARAGTVGRRAAVGAFGRVVWLATTAAGAIAGFVLATAVAHVAGADPLFATLGGTAGGGLMGSQRGVGWAKRMTGEPVHPWAMRVVAALAAVALVSGLAVDLVVRR
jgi:hypothetical protein